ncbi:MAG: universal stress protein [Verrucomicrobiales bacterium]|nr:universal stress protein [Verrucomicrobiales bacterium]
MSTTPTQLGPESRGTGSPRGPEVSLNRILVPVDFSPESKLGGRFAGEVASRFHSQIHWLHVIEPPSLPEWGYVHMALREKGLRDAATSRLPQFPQECGVSPAQVASTRLRNGEAAAQICQEAKDTTSDLIIMASHGLGGWSHVMGGSTTLRVIRHAPCPVLTVRDRALSSTTGTHVGRQFKRILVTTDFSDASKKALPYAVALAHRFEASLSLLFVVPEVIPAEFAPTAVGLEEERLLAEARERLPHFREAELDPHLVVNSIVLNGSPAAEICRTAELQNSDLIVMATHGRSGASHFILGSVTENVVRHAPCPVLVVREREHEFVKASTPPPPAL